MSNIASPPAELGVYLRLIIFSKSCLILNRIGAPSFGTLAGKILLEAIVLLRDHPLMSYKRVPSWPPVWTWTYGGEDQRPRGEIGILKEVFFSIVQPADRCFLYIDYEGSSYLGALLFDDYAFCNNIAEFLQFYLNCSIAEIGGLELPLGFPEVGETIYELN